MREANLRLVAFSRDLENNFEAMSLGLVRPPFGSEVYTSACKRNGHCDRLRECVKLILAGGD
jgi:hypothetical protein